MRIQVRLSLHDFTISEPRVALINLLAFLMLAIFLLKSCL